MKPELSIGMATYDDFDGIYFSVQALRLYHQESVRRCELIVVDNNSSGPHGKAVQEFLGWVKGDFLQVKYVPFTGPQGQGTSAPRQHIFEVAEGESVLAMDCHVLLCQGALEGLLNYYSENPQTPDLLSGPMVYDDLKNYSTHMNDEWRGEMWGTWGTDTRIEKSNVWKCRCGKTTFEVDSKVNKTSNTSTFYVNYLTLPEYTSGKELSCGCVLPTTSYFSDEDLLKENGCVLVAGLPFEIPAMGLGLFSSRKQAWQGFNPGFRGFGGEEWYIHEKFRKVGAKCLCLPFLRWVHRFSRPGGVKYPLIRQDKVRNYILGHRELGIPLDRCRAHFLSAGMPATEFDNIVDEIDGTTSKIRIGRSTKMSDKDHLEATSPHSEVHSHTDVVIKSPPQLVKRPGGPGTELTNILKRLGIDSGPACDCRAKALQMDSWGVSVCKNNREIIVSWMREGQNRWGWKDKLRAVANAVMIGLAFKLNPLDPFPSLVDEAIRLAEEKEGLLPVIRKQAKITVCMPTYNRAAHQGRCLDEAVESFLRQTWQNKELIIYNDCGGQTILYDHPLVKVINTTKRSPCFAHKRNVTVRAGDGDLIVPFDDDDIYLPWALEAMVEAIADREYALISGFYYSEGNRILQRLPHAHQNCVIYTRELFERVGGYRVPYNADVDQDFNTRSGKEFQEVIALEPFFIYRWGDGNFKLSGVLPKFTGDTTQWDTIGKRVVEEGVFQIRPTWFRDYERDLVEFNTTGK